MRKRLYLSWQYTRVVAVIVIRLEAPVPRLVTEAPHNTLVIGGEAEADT